MHVGPFKVLTLFPFKYHVTLTGGNDGGDVQFPLIVYPISRGVFSITITGSSSGISVMK